MGILPHSWNNTLVSIGILNAWSLMLSNVVKRARRALERLRRFRCAKHNGYFSFWRPRLRCWPHKTTRPDAPGGWGFPAWHDAQFSLIPINPSDWAWSRRVPPQLPSEIASYGSVPLVRPSGGAFYSEVVRVPAGTTLSVVIR